MRNKDSTEKARNPTQDGVTPEGPAIPERSGPRPKDVRNLLLAAYDSGKRNLPWREESDPYRIWVSEVMLQQTRVETVVPYYRKWVERFPTIDSLAEAEEDEVLRVWQGLGYYSRARRLHHGARLVRERYDGALPRNSEALRELPGIGEYTAGAVASIAFGEPVPAVDGNVKRVLARLFDLPSPTPSGLRTLAGNLVDRGRPGDFNQALMELGASVCTPRSPRCEVCPISSECLALERGTVGERPAPKAKKPVPEKEVAVLVAVARDEEGEPSFLLRKRPPTGLLAGMWEFPEVGSGVGLESVAELETVTHVFSHLKARYRPFLVFVSRPPPSGYGGEGPRWIPAGNLSDVPLSVAQEKIAEAALKFLAG